MSKFGEFQHALVSSKADIAVVTETKITAEKFSLHESAIPGYSGPLRRDRTEHGGGIAIWIRSPLAYHHLDQYDSSVHEVTWLTVQSAHHGKIVLGAVYRPGSASDTDISTLEHLDGILDSVRKHGTHTMLVGDFNVHNTAWLGSSKTTRAGEYMEELSAAHSLMQHVQEPTRGLNTLDLVLSDFTGTVTTGISPPIGRSDHCVVHAVLAQAPLENEPSTRRRVWRYGQADWNRLRAHYRRIAWAAEFPEDPEEACSLVTRHIVSGMLQFIPHKMLETRPSDPSWWTPECTEAQRAKEKAWKAWRHQGPSECLKQSFMTTVTQSITTQHRAQQAEEQTVRERLTRGSMRDKDWWRNVKRAAGLGRTTDVPTLTDADGHEHSTSKAKSECLARFFAEKCSLGDNDIDNAELPATPCTTTPGLQRVRFRVSEVQQCLKRLNTSKSTGPDEIPGRVLKECAAELAHPLARLFRLCFANGVQPQSWKIARVVPVHKKGPKSMMKNYRPISLLTIISKIMEGIINRQLVNHLETHQLFSSSQFGFRRGLGTSDLLTALQHSWATTLAGGGLVHALAVDIAGAFDKVSHPGVLAKAQQCGIHGQLLAWLRSYLHDRKLTVVVGGQSSPLFPIKAGVPQGSLLGPTLFLLYVNDAEQCLAPGSSLAVYADDTTLYALIRNPDTIAAACNSLQASIDRLQTWGAQWKIKFEPSKSQAILLDRHRPSLDVPQLTFDGMQVPESPQLKLLGVLFDSTLSFRAHIRSLAVRANQRLGLLRKASRILDSAGRLTVYKGFVRPIMEYAPLVWASAAHCHLHQLDLVQRRAMKVIGPSLLPSLAIRRHVYGLCYLYKLQCIPGPALLTNMVPPPARVNAAPRTRRQRQSLGGHSFQLATPLPASSPEFIRRSFPYFVLESWNTLPAPILAERPTLKKLPTFKTKAYHHLRQTNWLWATEVHQH